VCSVAFDDDVLRLCPSTTIRIRGFNKSVGHQPTFSASRQLFSHHFSQLKEEARAIERQLRDALAAVAEQEAVMRADEGEKHRAELRRQEYSRQWSKDDDRLSSLERSVQAFAPQSPFSFINLFS
jgi:hypothetical protein